MMKRLSSKGLLGDGAGVEAESAVREMMERHALEVAQLENELRSEEISKINEVQKWSIINNKIITNHLKAHDFERFL